MTAAFCTCRDKRCPMNPANHDKGCTPCVAKCLREGELPSCFFNAVTPYRGPDADYSYRGFARAVLGEEAATQKQAECGARSEQDVPAQRAERPTAAGQTPEKPVNG